jgi:hypothetical protein
VIGKNGYSNLTMGDNSPKADGMIPRKSILGSVQKVERDGKKVYRGLGPERFLIAFLTCRGLLFPLFSSCMETYSSHHEEVVP